MGLTNAPSMLRDSVPEQGGHPKGGEKISQRAKRRGVTMMSLENGSSGGVLGRKARILEKRGKGQPSMSY